MVRTNKHNQEKYRKDPRRCFVTFRVTTLAVLLLGALALGLIQRAEPAAGITVKPPVSTQQTAQNVELVGHVGGATYAVDVVSNYAYIGVGPELAVLDISDPSQPRSVGALLLLPGIVKGIDVNWPYAYVIDGGGRLRVVEVSNPRSPREVGFYDTGWYADGVFVTGGYAYVTDGGLRVLDVSDPASPREVGFYDTPGYAKDVFVSGHYAYIADGPRGLRVVAVSDPTSPREVGFYDTEWYAEDVFVTGGFAYVTDGGLRVLDVSDPASPREVGFYDTPGNAEDVFVTGGFAYVTEHRMWDQHCECYVGGGLRAVDVSDPASPREVGFYDTLEYAEDVFVTGGFAYVADAQGGLRMIDVSSIAALREVGFYETLGNAEGVFVSGHYAYIADGPRGLRVMAVSDPASPREVGFYDTPGSAEHVFVSGKYAYVADGQMWVEPDHHAVGAGRRVVDVIDPTSPHEVGFYTTMRYTYDVFVAGAYAFVTDVWDDLVVVDVSNPASPRRVSDYLIPRGGGGDEISVFVLGGYAYLTGVFGLSVADVSTPASPQEVGFFDTPEGGRDVFVAGGYVYVADGGGGLFILQPVGIRQPQSYLPLILRQAGTICDAGFETGHFEPCWDHAGELGRRVVDRLDTGKPAFAGHYSALLGQPELGSGNNGNIPAGSAWIQQRIQIPGTPQPRLTFQYRVVSYDASVGSDGRLWDTFDAFIGEKLVFRDDHGEARPPGSQGGRHDTGWRPGAVNLIPWRGQEVVLRFAVWNREYDGNGMDYYNTWAYLDDVQVEP